MNKASYIAIGLAHIVLLSGCVSVKQAEYESWLASADKEDCSLLEMFELNNKERQEARAERRKRREMIKAITALDLAEIREAYRNAGDERLAHKYEHRYYDWSLLQKLKDEEQGSEAYEKIKSELEAKRKSDWLKEWVEPRNGLSEEDKLAGEALLSEFGNKYMPKAYANYEKVKEVARELQQIFNEEFPEPWMISEDNDQWQMFNDLLEKFVRVRTEYFYGHDELCHCWLYHRLGVLTTDDLKKIDSQTMAVNLLPENKTRAGDAIVMRVELDAEDADFAARYAPNTYALYQDFEQEWKQVKILLQEVSNQRIILDDVRFNRAFYHANFKFNDLARELNTLVEGFKTWRTNQSTKGMSPEDIAQCDKMRAEELKQFAEALPTYIKDRTLGRIINPLEMIKLPRGLKVQRTEVTQMQWMLVMGNNPSRFIQPDGPVENISWDDCQEFIKQLSEMDGVTYRLPWEEEWEYACQAGSNEGWGMRRNGENGPIEVMGWFEENSDQRTHSVALKEPNMWGLYDMHGNVWEWCQNEDWGRRRVVRGRSYRESHYGWFYAPNGSDRANRFLQDHCSGGIGLRLISEEL